MTKYKIIAGVDYSVIVLGKVIELVPDDPYAFLIDGNRLTMELPIKSIEALVEDEFNPETDTKIDVEHLKDLFTLMRTDNTDSAYSVKFVRDCSLMEFLFAVLHRTNEWGEIYVLKNDGDVQEKLIPNIEYRHGNLLKNDIHSDIHDNKVRKVEAFGKDSRIDYYVVIE